MKVLVRKGLTDWLDGFKDIPLRLQDLLLCLDPLVGGFGAGRVTDESAMIAFTGRRVGNQRYSYVPST